ncbi:PHP domain-containing protein, partial [Candidatus Hydrogenedentota bacterium]
VMDAFVSLPVVKNVMGKGETKSSVVLDSGMNAGLRIVTDDHFPFALHHFTGSREHNTATRARARALGIEMNEYGLFRGERPIECSDEIEIFAALNLDYIPPELRENMGEIEAAEEKRLPELVERCDLRGTFHVHSNYSDGANTLAEIARAGSDMELEYIGMSDHSKAASYAGGLKEEDVEKQHAEIDSLNASSSGCMLLKGVESDILPDGSLDYSPGFRNCFDFIVVSIHSNFNMNEVDMTRRIIKAIEDPHTSMLGHPTGRLLLMREEYKVDVYRLIDAAAHNGVAIEINANPNRLDLDWRPCKYAREKGVLLAINTDAHRIETLAHLDYGIGIARKGWLEKDDVLNTRGLDEVMKLLNRRKNA